VLWLIWCSAWAGFWLVAAMVMVGDPAVHSSAGFRLLAAGLSAGSVGAALLPVGKQRMHAPPPSHPVHRNPKLRDRK